MVGLDQEILAAIRWLDQVDLASEPRIVERSRHLLLDTIGCAIAGFRARELQSLAARLSASDPGVLSLPGLVGRFSSTAAAFLIGTAACWDEACEGLEAAHGRPGLHAISAVVPLALAKKSTLGDLLSAIVTGYEIGGRIGIAYRIRAGMHVDGTWGTFAAAAAAGRLFGLRPDEIMAAIDTAACQLPFSLYHPITQGSRARNTYVGHGAAIAALLAASAVDIPGLGGGLAVNTDLALGRRLDSLAPAPPPGHWLVLDGYLKKYPAVRHVHFGIELGARWHRERGPDTHKIRNVRLRIYREAMTYCGNRAPRHAIQAQFSLSYGLAHALRCGTLTPEAYAGESLADRETRRLENLIFIEHDPALTSMNRRGAELHIEDGQGVWSFRIADVPGDPNHPLDRVELVSKFTGLTTPLIGLETSNQFVNRILDGPLDQTFDPLGRGP